MSDTGDSAENFILIEYEALRREIEIDISSIRRTDEMCLLAYGAIFAWIFTQEVVIQPAFLLPPIISLLFYIRRFSIQRGIERFHTYIMSNVEKKIGFIGWEHFIDDKPDPINKWAHLYYGVLILGGFVTYYLVVNDLLTFHLNVSNK